MARTVDFGEGWVLTEFAMKGTQAGPFMGTASMGYPVEVKGVQLVQFDADGLVAKMRLYYFGNHLLDQMGIAPWPLDGIWITTYPTGAGNLISTTVYTAQDAAKTRYTGTLEFLNSFEALGLYPDADPSLRVYAGGHAVMVGRNKYESMYLGYDRTFDASTGVMEVVGLHTVDAQFELLDANVLQGHGVASYYMAAQDADQDGFPDEGQAPALSYPFMWTGKRLTPLP